MGNATKHNMTIRDEGQAALYDDAEETSMPYDISALPTTSSSNNITDLDGKTAAGYSEETAAKKRSGAPVKAL